MSGRGGIGGFFLWAGLACFAVGLCLMFFGGSAGRIAGLTFTLIGGIWALVGMGLKGFYGGMRKRRQAERRLFETGVKAVATIESVETTGMVLNNINQQIVLRLRIEAAGHAAFVHERKMFVPFHGIPRTGDQIDVAFDPSDNSRVALATDWRSDTAGGNLLLTRRGSEAPMPAGMGAATAAGGVDLAPAPAQSTAPERVIAQLERLQKLKQDGVLSDSEFVVQKAKVLSGQDV